MRTLLSASEKASAEPPKLPNGQKITPDFESFYVTPTSSSQLTKQQEFSDYWLVVAALGRFMDQDIKHQIHLCKFYDYMQANKQTPPVEKMPEILGYESLDALNAAFTDFILTKNTKLRY